jgi:hypothetical protein
MMKIMKKIISIVLSLSLFLGISISCQDFEELNIDPNNPSELPSNMLMAGVEKRIMDYVYDAWFSGRQCLLYAQYWAQRNYTEEDRYQIRESVNNNYFNTFYLAVANLDKIISLNSDEATAEDMAAYGSNQNQIAAAKTLRAWLLLLMTDTWGNIPYNEIGKLEEGLYFPKYDEQEDIYKALQAELKAASDGFNVNEAAFSGGDNIYGGDASKWKKFANSLRCRIAIHLSKVDPQWKTYISEALASGVFESNDDNAAYAYSATGPNECYFYRSYFVDARNDFSITAPFVDILKGQRDTLNNKTHPWEGLVDPRLAVYTNPRASQYIGMPYGIENGTTATPRGLAPDWLSGATPLCIRADFAVPLMTYAEVLFILSEYNGFSKAEYEEGVRASLEYWSQADGAALPADAINAYVAGVSATVNAETVALQKYIDLYMNGTEAWTEYRRTGYPTQLLKPNEVSYVNPQGEAFSFVPLSETKGDIIARVKYPTNESTLNGPSFDDAVSRLDDKTNNYYTKMFWDVRSSGNPHPANK